MAAVVTGACIGRKEKACVDQCPTECFHEGADQLYVDPDSCTDCGGCLAVCPVNAIHFQEDVPPELASFIEKNARVFTDQHQAGCGCGACDPATGRAIGRLQPATPARG